MHSDQLVYLIEISKNQSLNLASQKLNITPQALGSSIRMLENELNLKLLDRTHKGSRLTIEGEKIVAVAQRFLNDVSDILEGNKTQLGQRICGNLQIAINYDSLQGFLPHLICDLYKTVPQFRLNYTELTQKELYQCLLDDTYEIGLAFQTCVNGKVFNAPPEDLIFTPLMKCKVVCQMNHKFCIADHKTLSMSTILKYPIILCAPSIDKNASFYCLLLTFGQPENLRLEHSLPIFKEMVTEGLGITLSLMFPSINQPPAFFDTLPAIPIKDDIDISLGTLVKANRPCSIICQDFIDYLGLFVSTCSTTFAH